MKFNDYVRGKELYKNTFLYESFINEEDLSKKYNRYLKTNNYDLTKLFEASDEPGIFKKIIGRLKLNKEAKRYIRAYYDWRFTDIEERKVKLSKSWENSTKEQNDQKLEAFKVKKAEGLSLTSEISNRIDIIGKTHGIPNTAMMFKSKAKVKASERIIKQARGLFTDGQYEDLLDNYKTLKINAEDSAKKAVEEQKAIEDVDQIALLKKNGYTEVSDENKDKLEDIQTIKDKDGNAVKLGKNKTETDTETKPDVSPEIDKIKTEKEKYIKNFDIDFNRAKKEKEDLSKELNSQKTIVQNIFKDKGKDDQEYKDAASKEIELSKELSTQAKNLDDMKSEYDKAVADFDTKIKDLETKTKKTKK
jgi:hypothetical protein